MKYFKIILVITLLSTGFFTAEAQRTEQATKIATINVPAKVQQVLKDYAGYKIDEQASYIKKRGEGTIYAFKIQRKYSSFTLLVNKKGKVVGIREGERDIK